MKSYRPAGLYMVLALLVLALAVVSLFPLLFSIAGRYRSSIYEEEYFVEEIYRNGFVLYWELQQKEAGAPLSPQQVFLPDYERAKVREELFIGDNGPYIVEYGIPSVAVAEDESAWELQETCNRQLAGWREEFHSEWNNLAYLAVSDGGTLILNGSEELVELLEEGVSHQDDKYDYWAVIRYGEDGSIDVRQVHGAATDSLDSLELYSHWEHWEKLFDDSRQFDRSIELPSEMTVLYAVPRGAADSSLLDYQQIYLRSFFGSAGFTPLFITSLAVAAALGLVSAWKGHSWFRLAGKIPGELTALLVMWALSFHQPLCWAGASMIRRELVFSDPRFAFTGNQSLVLGLCIAYGLQLAALALAFLAAYSLRQLWELGPWRYLGERTLCGRFLQWCAQVLRELHRKLTSVDFSQPANRFLRRILLCNYALLWVLSLMLMTARSAFVALFFLGCYSILAFVLCRHFVKRQQASYLKLLQTTQSMAQGRLDVALEGDMGIFVSLGEELQKVQAGFRQAVEAEVRSQNMRTELVSNVSHDLKTPLTAIITYINLLKNEAVTDEERRSYVETLDNKAQRLKGLIEDLFEVSKASSGNMTVELAPVDLPSLIRQVQLEVKDEIERSGVDFRHRFNRERVEVMLDGEKTSRIFENLIINVTKYAMPGTRAYIDLVADGGGVTVEIKNISREPLDFDTGDLTERFVRGDRSRNTEGSGLGLAIVKSFVELQGGAFRVAADGDLFKAVIEFPFAEELASGAPEDFEIVWE